MFLLPVARGGQWRGMREHPGNLSREREGNRIYNSQERGEREWPSDKNQINPPSMNFMMPDNDTGYDPHYQSECPVMTRPESVG